VPGAISSIISWVDEHPKLKIHNYIDYNQQELEMSKSTKKVKAVKKELKVKKSKVSKLKGKIRKLKKSLKKK